MTPVQRLKQTWKKVGKKLQGKLQDLNQLFQTQGNYRRYKEALSEAQQKEEPVIPYLGLYSKYLLAIETSSGNFVSPEKTKVNFQKMRLIFGTTRQMLLFQRRVYMCGRDEHLF